MWGQRGVRLWLRHVAAVALVPNEEPSCGTTARARRCAPPPPSPSLSLCMALGLSLIATPVPLLNGEYPRSPCLAGARCVYYSSPRVLPARFACALLAGASGDSAAGRWGPGRGLLYLTLAAPVGSVSSVCRLCVVGAAVRPRGLVGERQL